MIRGPESLSRRTTKTLPSSVAASSCESPGSPRDWRRPSASSSSVVTPWTNRSARPASAIVVATTLPSPSTIATWTTCEEISVRSASAWAASMRRSILLLIRAIARKFFADRGTHLAAMIAYFALLSFVPLLFLSLAVLSTAGQANSGSFFVRELHRTFPSTSLDSLLRAVQAIRENATALVIFGVAFLTWSSLSLFSVLESAFNIVYGRPNRPFVRGKLLATMMMVGSLAFLFASLGVGSVGAGFRGRYTGIGHSVSFVNQDSGLGTLIRTVTFPSA